MAPGRKSKPTSLKVLEGNPGKRPLNDQEPQPDQLDRNNIPKPPPYLNLYAKKEWKRVAPLLIEIKVLTEADLTAFETYCNTYGIYVEANRKAKKEGLIIQGPKGIQKHPALGLANECATQMRQFMTEFGLTPSSRSRIKIAPGKETDEFSEFDD